MALLHSCEIQPELLVPVVDSGIDPGENATRGHTEDRMLLLAVGSAVVLAAPATEPCASTCAHSNCEGLNIHYGTYCGVGHTGCPGVKPCDDFDACCEAHDNCVTVNSIVSTGCHSTLSSCLHKALERGSRTWIQEKQEGLPAEAAMCTPTQLVKTMTSGMQLASMFSLFMGGGASQRVPRTPAHQVKGPQ